jgi:hypothetical protein
MEKPGWKTSEFWLSLAAVAVGALLSAGVLAADGTTYKIAAFVASALTALGYTWSRTAVKTAELAALDAGDDE